MTNVPKVICVVDDDLALGEALRFVLSTRGFHVRVFGTGAEFMARIKELPPSDVLVIDEVLPDASGIELVGRARALGVAVPCLLITTHPSTALIEKATKMGIRILEKPLLGDDLVQAIASI